MGFAQELKDFTAGFDAARDRKIKGLKYKTEWEKIRPITDKDIEGVPDEPLDGGGKIDRVDGGGDNKGGSTSSTGSYEYSDINIKDDPEAAKVLGLIRSVEAGEDPYNKLVGGKTGNLTDMTVGEVLQYQKSMLAQGHESTALGGYQFINDTLRAAVRDTKTPLDAKFDQATQDALGYHLLQKRGWNEYKAGKLDKDTFMDNLASEWASLPLQNGKSAYAGVGSNASLIGRDQVAAALDFGADPAVASADSAARAGVKASAKAQGIPEDNPLVDSSADLKEADEADEVAEIDFGEQPEVALSDWTEFAQPMSEWERLQQQGGGATMFAERGGVVQSFADGGIPDEDPPPLSPPVQGMPASLAAARNAGMQGGGWPATAAAGTWRPSRVGTLPVPGPSKVYAPGELTSSQQALKTARTDRAAAEKAAADKAAADAAAAAAKPGTMDAKQFAEMMAQYNKDQFRQNWMNSMLHAMNPGGPRGAGRGGSPGYTTSGPGGAGSFGSRSSSASRAGGGLYEEGGVIPEPEDVSFATGGKVESRDEIFKRLLQQESRPGSQRDSGSSARDRAARRLSQQEGRASSTAYSPTQDSEYFTPAKPRKTKRVKGGAKKTDPIETKSTPKVDPREEQRKEQRENKPGTKKGTDTPPKPGRLSDENAEAPGRDPDRTKDDRVIREPRTKDDEVAIPEPSGPIARPDARGTLPLQVKPQVGYPRPDARTAPAEPEPPPVVNPRVPTVPPQQRPDARSAPAGRPLAATPPGVPPAGVSPLPRPDPTAAEPNVPPMVSPPAPNRIAPAYVGGDSARGAGGAPGEPTGGMPRPDARTDPANEPFTWRDFLNIFMDDNYKGPSGEGVMFAEGGAVPDEEDEVLGRSQRDPGYTTSRPGAPSPSSARGPFPAAPEVDDVETASVAPQEKAAVRATPQLMKDVRMAVDGGVNFLTRTFGLTGDGAMPTPEDAGNRQAGMQRLASGEGAATAEELQGVDDKIDPNRELDEGKRQMLRYAKTMRWYQQRGRKEEAEAAAASFMQYGAQRFSRLGSLAEVSYREYLKTKDPSHLDKTAQLIEQAYAMVPDGAEIDIRINEATGKIEATHVDEDGNEEFSEVDPNEIPGLIRGVQDKSLYWNSIFRIADPEGAKSKDIEERDIRGGERDEARTKRTEKRAAERKAVEDAATLAQKEIDYQRGRTDKAADAAAAAKEHDRQALLAAGIARAQKKYENTGVDFNKLNPLLAEISAADAADDEVAADAARSKLWDSLPNDENRAKIFKDITGLNGTADFNYTTTQPAMPPKPAGAPTTAVLKKHPETGAPVWANKEADGSWTIY